MDEKNKYRITKMALLIVEVIWIILLTFGCVAAVDVIQSYAAPHMEGTEYIIAEIHTQDDAIEITEAPLIELNEDPIPVYAGITLTEYEGDLLERILWAEANNQSFEGQKAVIEVIFNRLRSEEWPDTIEGVLSQKGQFATWKNRNKVTPTEVQSDVISDVLRETETVLPDTTYVYFDTKGRNGKAHIRIGGHVFGK